MFSKAIKTLSNPASLLNPVAALNAVGTAASGGFMRGGNPARAYKMPYSVSTYARPQRQFAMNQATNPTTYGDAYADKVMRKPSAVRYVGPQSTGFGGGGNSGMFDGGSLIKNNVVNPNNALPGANEAGLSWADFNGPDAGGMQAYRYAWQQPGYQAPTYKPEISQQDLSVVNQPAPDVTSNAWKSDVQPRMNAASTSGWGFNNTQPGRVPFSAFLKY